MWINLDTNFLNKRLYFVIKTFPMAFFIHLLFKWIHILLKMCKKQLVSRKTTTTHPYLFVFGGFFLFLFSPTRLGSPIALLIPPYLRLISSDMTAALFLAELVRIVSGVLLSVESCFWLVREFTILHFVNLSYSRSSAIGFTADLSSIQFIRIYYSMVAEAV